MKTASCGKSAKSVAIVGLPVIKRSIAAVYEDSVFMAYGGMVGGFIQYDEVFCALIAS